MAQVAANTAVPKQGSPELDSYKCPVCYEHETRAGGNDMCNWCYDAIGAWAADQDQVEPGFNCDASNVSQQQYVQLMLRHV